ncbi:MAG: hypothetical protein KC502_03845 [Myxococcales bacterium]|nr:hypothetical protein [Myxococcales bacterium]
MISPTAPRWLVLGALMIAIAVGCSGAATLPNNGPQNAAAVLKRALARPLPKTVQGMSRLEAFVGGQARKADVIVLIERPNRAQFRALTPTMDLVAVLSTDGTRFMSYERGAPKCFVGQACPENMARLVPIALPPKQLVSAVLGRPPLISAASSRLSWDKERSAYLVTRTSADGAWVQQVWIAPTTFRFRASVVRHGNKRVVSIAYGDLDKLGAKAPPGIMRLKVPSKKIDMSLTLREITIDEDIDDAVFSIPCPSGTVAIELPCAATAIVR